MTSLCQKILEGSTLTKKSEIKDVMTLQKKKKLRRSYPCLFFTFKLDGPPITFIVGWRIISKFFVELITTLNHRSTRKVRQGISLSGFGGYSIFLKFLTDRRI